MRDKVKSILRRAGFKVSNLNIRNDLWCLLSHLLEKNHVRTVMDVGANSGQFLAHFHEKMAYEPDHFLSFEPIPEVYHKLKSAADRTPRATKIATFNMALGDKTQTEMINVTPNLVSTSLLLPAEDYMKFMGDEGGVKAIEVEVKRFDDFKRSLETQQNATADALNGPLFVKLDVQGFELKVLEGFGPCLRDVRVLLLECSFVKSYEDRPLFEDIMAFMTAHGFHISGVFPGFFDQSNVQLLELEAVFTRTKAA